MIRALPFKTIFVPACSFVCKGWFCSLLDFSPCINTFSCRLSSSGCMLAVFSISETGVIFIAPKMVLRPRFWTRSRLLFVDLAGGVFKDRSDCSCVYRFKYSRVSAPFGS